jgi:hypothetical protein
MKYKCKYFKTFERFACLNTHLLLYLINKGKEKLPDFYVTRTSQNIFQVTGTIVRKDVHQTNSIQ